MQMKTRIRPRIRSGSRPGNRPGGRKLTRKPARKNLAEIPRQIYLESERKLVLNERVFQSWGMPTYQKVEPVSLPLGAHQVNCSCIPPSQPTMVSPKRGGLNRQRNNSKTRGYRIGRSKRESGCNGQAARVGRARVGDAIGKPKVYYVVMETTMMCKCISFPVRTAAGNTIVVQENTVISLMGCARAGNLRTNRKGRKVTAASG